MNSREFFRLVQAQVHLANSNEYRMNEHDRRCTKDQGNGTSIYEAPNGSVRAEVNDTRRHVLKATGTFAARCKNFFEAKEICAQGVVDRGY